MASFKSTFLKFPFVPVFTGMFFALFLASCGQNGDRQTTISAGAQDNFSSPIPAQLEKARTGLNAKVIVDGGTANVRIIDLQVDTQNDRVVGTIPNLPARPHTFEIQYFIDNVLIATAPVVTVTIQANADTPVPFDTGALVYPDTDNDGFTNLNEVEIFGSTSDAWTNPNTKPEVSVVVNPGTAILPPNGVQTFTAAIAQNANQGVTWSVEGGDANGTITPGGTYTAPEVSGTTYNVVATSQADPTKIKTIPVTVVNPGSRDVSFDADGSVDTVIPTSNSSTIQDIAVQADGKILAAGFSNISANHFTLARYTTDGALDATFGTGGIVTSPVPNSSSSFIQAVAIQSDGKIIAAGSSTIGTTRFTLARYNTDGNIDTSFGTGGFVTSVISTSASSTILDIAIQADGKIVAAGASTIVSSHFTVARYDTDGNFDTSFGTGGSVFTAIPTSTSSTIQEIAIQADGKIVAAGPSVISSNNRFTLVRYEANGNLDNSFGTGGVVTTVIPSSTSSNIQGVSIQSDGKIVAAGFSFISSSNRFTLARYDTSGSLDASFGTAGIVTTEIPTSTNSAALSLVLQTDGKIVAAGHSNTPQTNFTLARYNPNGSLDTSFNGNGVIITTIPNSTLSLIQSVAIQGDGKVIAAGGSTISTGRFTLVRYHTGITPVLLRATLSGSEEIPAVTTLGAGSATFAINPGGTEISYTLHIADIGISGITAVQIHFGARGEEGRALFTLTSSPFVSPLTGKLTAADLERIAATEGINTFADAIKSMRDGNTYLHVHTSTHLGGEIRGQILEAPPTLSLLQAQIFSQRCGNACHKPGGPGGNETGLFLDTLENSFNLLVNVPSTQTEGSNFKRVEPFNPDASFLVKKLTDPTLGLMPASGPPLSDEEIQKVRDWISAGAKND